VKVTVLTNIPTPYRAPLYSELDSALRKRNGALTVLYGARSAPDRQWADSIPPVGTAKSIFIPRSHLRRGAKQRYVNPLVVGSLHRTSPDVVVLGGFAPWNYAAAAWCSSRGIPYLIWCGETLRSFEFSLRLMLRRMPLIRGATGFLAYGPDAAEYFVSIGAPRRRLTVVGNGIDVKAFSFAVDRARDHREEIRSGLGLTGATILSVGGKELNLVAAAINRTRSKPQLALVGSRTTNVGFPGVVNIGRVPASRMPSIYAAVDCLVHPAAIDRWPHAINEALAAGIPVVASPSTGVPPDVLRGPGCAIVVLDPGCLGTAIDEALALSAASRADVQQAIRQRIETWSVPGMVNRWLSALDAASSESRASVGP